MQKKLLEINFTERMIGTQKAYIKGFKNGNIYKENERTIIQYQNGTTITCLFRRKTSFGYITGIGIAKCHPEDNFNYQKGILLAELRARSDFYKKLAEREAKRR